MVHTDTSDQSKDDTVEDSCQAGELPSQVSMGEISEKRPDLFSTMDL